MFSRVERVDRVELLYVYTANHFGLLQGLSLPNPNPGHKEQEKEENV